MPSITGPLYAMVRVVAKELKNRGYTVVKLAAGLGRDDSDQNLYLENYQGISPVQIELPEINSKEFGLLIDNLKSGEVEMIDENYQEAMDGQRYQRGRGQSHDHRTLQYRHGQGG